MDQACARAILRIIAILTMFFGACITTTTMITFYGTSKAMGGFTGNSQGEQGIFDAMFTYGLLSNAAWIAWGFLLFILSPWLASRVVR